MLNSRSNTFEKKIHSGTPLLLTGLLVLSMVLTLMQTLFLGQAMALEIPKQSDAFYVNDLSDVLSEETEEYIVSTNLDLYRKTGAQVVVVTIKTLNGDSLEEFATELFRTYGIGDKEKNNGLLLLLVTEDRKSRIEVGYGLEGTLNDAKTGRIQDDYMIPYFRDGKWEEGLRNGFDAFLAEIAKEYDIELDSTAPVKLTTGSTSSDQDDSAFSDSYNTLGAIALFLSVVVGCIVGKAFYGSATIPHLIWFVLVFLFFVKNFTLGETLLVFFGTVIFTLIGYCITAPIDTDGGGGYSSGGGSSYSSRSSSSSSSSSHYSGGGGRSGGGGSSRSF